MSAQWRLGSIISQDERDQETNIARYASSKPQKLDKIDQLSDTGGEPGGKDAHLVLEGVEE